MILKTLAPAALLMSLTACEGTLDTTFDFGLDRGDITKMKAGIWVDPNGCEHWIIDDGVEGYMSPRRNAETGKPVCRDVETVDGNTEGFQSKIIGDS